MNQKEKIIIFLTSLLCGSPIIFLSWRDNNQQKNNLSLKKEKKKENQKENKKKESIEEESTNDNEIIIIKKKVENENPTNHNLINENERNLIDESQDIEEKKK